LNPGVGAGQFQGASTGSDPHMHDHQLAETGAVDNFQAGELDYDLACVGQEFRYFLRECRGLIAVGKTAPAVKNHDIIDGASFQI
jgi:hypothetical protein